MSVTVCLLTNALYYPQGGGHAWLNLNWALELRALGCQVVWLELVDSDTPAYEVRAYVAILKSRLGRYGLAESVALCSWTDEPLPRDAAEGYLNLEAAAEADLLLNLAYGAPPGMLRRFWRSALVDIDPGLTQVWMSKGCISVAQHDVYFTIGETVGQPGAWFPDGGLKWQYTPPCVALDWWQPHRAAEDAAFTTASHRYQGEWIEDTDGSCLNDKRSGFLPCLDLPRRTEQPLELALTCGDVEAIRLLTSHGWRIIDGLALSRDILPYHDYILNSCGEFTVAKDQNIRLRSGWFSDRSACYLATRRPVITQDTGFGTILPSGWGLFAFQTMGNILAAMEAIAIAYEGNCRAAREIAAEYFAADKVIGSLMGQMGV